MSFQNDMATLCKYAYGITVPEDFSYERICYSKQINRMSIYHDAQSYRLATIYNSEFVPFASLFKSKETINPLYVLAFRGTMNFRDWLTDLTFEPQSYQDDVFMQGFLTLYDSLYPAIEDLLALVPTTSFLEIIGHSLGGALAQILMSRVSMNGQGLTFACPRIGIFQDKMQQGINNLINPWDIVPKVPPFYERLGTDIDLNCPRSFDELKNHHIQTYIDNIP